MSTCPCMTQRIAVCLRSPVALGEPDIVVGQQRPFVIVQRDDGFVVLGQAAEVRDFGFGLTAECSQEHVKGLGSGLHFRSEELQLRR